MEIDGVEYQGATAIAAMQKKLFATRKHNFQTFEKEIDCEVFVGYDALAAINRKRMTDDLAYEENTAKLVAFSEREGHCNVPTRGVHQVLGKWVSHQRTEYKEKQEGKPILITDQRVEALKAVGFEFDPREASYKEKITELEAFKQLKGHCNVPVLGGWVGTQRAEDKKKQAGKNSNLTVEAPLEALGFQWSIGRK